MIANSYQSTESSNCIGTCSSRKPFWVGPTTRKQKPTTDGFDGIEEKSADGDSSLLILICIAVLTLLAIACIFAIYVCCKKYVWVKPTETISIYNKCRYDPSPRPGKKSLNSQGFHDSNSPSPPDVACLPTIQNAVDTSSEVSNGSLQGSKSNGVKLAAKKSNMLFPNKAKSRLNQPKRPPPSLNNTAANKSSKSSSPASTPQTGPIMMDKVSITADMFNQNNDIFNKKETILFKALSFTE